MPRLSDQAVAEKLTMSELAAVLENAKSLLSELVRRALHLRHRLRAGKPADFESAIATYAATIAAVASLSPTNIEDLAAATRERRLPRRQGGK
jgi:hypothetical protein